MNNPQQNIPATQVKSALSTQAPLPYPTSAANFPSGGPPMSGMPPVNLPYPAHYRSQPVPLQQGVIPGCPFPGVPVHPTTLGTGPLTTGPAGHVLEPTPQEIQTKKMILQYNAGTDVYHRGGGSAPINGWKSCVFTERNMSRHIEAKTKASKSDKDNKVPVNPTPGSVSGKQIAYLARNAGTDSGYIEWRFDLTKAACRVKKVNIKFGSKVLGDGAIKAYIVNGTQRIDFRNEGKKDMDFKCKELQGGATFSINVVAELLSDPTGQLNSFAAKKKDKDKKKTEGKVKDKSTKVPKAPWQNAMLFSQEVSDTSPAFVVELSFE